jgi:HEPN domain-containing protein
MLNLPPEHYAQWTHVRKAVAFLAAAKVVDDVQNRTSDSWEVSYYLLSHAVELIIKGVAELKTGETAWGHDKQQLSEEYRTQCGFSDEEMKTIKDLKELNNGQGGLRYENEVNGEFLPSVFAGGVRIVERLIEENFQQDQSK